VTTLERQGRRVSRHELGRPARTQSETAPRAGGFERMRGTDVPRVDSKTGNSGVRFEEIAVRTFFRPGGSMMQYFVPRRSGLRGDGANVGEANESSWGRVRWSVETTIDPRPVVTGGSMGA